MLTVIDEYTRECLAIHVQRSLKHDDVLAVLTDLFTRYGPPEYIRSDNGSEFTAIAVLDGVRNGRFKRFTSRLDHLGRMDTMKASTGSFATSF